MQARCCGGGEDDGVSRRLQRTLLDRTGARTSVGRWRLLVNLVTCAPAPTVLLWRCATGAHQPVERLSAPDQGVDQGLGQLVEINLTFSPLISPYDLNLTSFFFSHSITDPCIECASSSRSVAIRFNSYNAPLCFETDT